MLKYEIREIIYRFRKQKKIKKTLLECIVFCEAVNSKFTTSFSL